MQQRPILRWWLIALLSLTGCLHSTEGLSPANSGEWINFSTSDGLADNYITAIYQDSSGLYWFGHDGYGVTTFDGETFNVITTEDGLTSNSVLSILQDKDGDVLFGTIDGLSIYRDGEWGYLPSVDGAIITSLFEDNLGRLWMGTYDYGAVVIENGDLYQILHNSCADCNDVLSITQTPDDHIWLGTIGGLRELTGDQITTYTTTDGLASNSITSMAVDDWGKLWLGCRSGTMVTRYANGQFETVSLQNDATDLWVTAIAKGKHGELWFGSVFYGATKYDGAVMSKIYKGPPAKTITKIFKDSDGNMWFGTFDGGVSKYITK
jgi:ligand-binding sensor domain-containing protein